MTNEAASGMGNTSIGIEKRGFLLAPVKNKKTQNISRPNQKRYLGAADLTDMRFLTIRLKGRQTRSVWLSQ